MTDPSIEAPPSLYRRYRQLSIGMKILIFMALGIIAGVAFGERAQIVQPLGDLFIRLLMMAAIPLVFFNLLAGLTSLSDLGVLGRLGGKIISYYLFTTVVALTLGLTMMHLFEPGVGMQLTDTVDETFGQVPAVTDVLVNLVPENVFQAFSSGQVAQVVVFAIFLGVATLLLPDAQRQTLKRAFEVLAEVLRKLVGVILYFGPIGIGALAASTVGQYGAEIFGPLAVFLGGIWSAQLVMVIVYMFLLLVFTRRSPIAQERRHSYHACRCPPVHRPGCRCAI